LVIAQSTLSLKKLEVKSPFLIKFVFISVTSVEISAIKPATINENLIVLYWNVFLKCLEYKLQLIRKHISKNNELSNQEIAAIRI
jgi:hypothetical protein